MNIKHHNHSYTANIPNSVGDRFYGQDRSRDFYHQKELSGIIAHTLTGLNDSLVLSGLTVTTGVGLSLDWTAGRALAKKSVTVPNSWSTLPPTVTTADYYVVFDVAAATGQSISGATTDGITINYAKVSYTENTGSSRTKALAGGSYNSEVTPGYTFTCNSTPPTAYEVTIATLTTDGATMILINDEPRWNRMITALTTYTVKAYDRYVMCSGTFTVTLPAAASSKNKIYTIKNIGTGVITVDANASETIDGSLTVVMPTRYQAIEIVCDGSNWHII